MSPMKNVLFKLKARFEFCETVAFDIKATAKIDAAVTDTFILVLIVIVLIWLDKFCFAIKL